MYELKLLTILLHLNVYYIRSIIIVCAHRD